MIDQQISEASQLLRQKLRDFMAANNLTRLTQLEQRVGIDRRRLGSYLAKKCLPTPENLRTLRQSVPEITEADARIIETAYSRKSSQSRSRGAERRFGRPRLKKSQAAASAPAPERCQPTTAPLSSIDRDAKIGRLVQQLLVEVVCNGSMRVSPLEPTTLLRSLAGERYHIGDMPSILTKDNFETLDVSQWSEADRQQFLGYANLVLEESRKCMLLLAQFKPDTIRDELLERLARNADLLWRTYKAASSVAPIEYIKDIELARKCERLVSQPHPSNGG